MGFGHLIIVLKISSQIVTSLLFPLFVSCVIVTFSKLRSPTVFYVIEIAGESPLQYLTFYTPLNVF